MTNTYLDSITADPQQLKLYQEERLIVAITELMCREMKQHGIRRADLAELLDKTKGRISQYLDGERNLTLRTVANIFTVMGMELRIEAIPIAAVNESQDEEPVILRCVSQAWNRQKAWSIPAEYECPVTPDALAG